MLSEKIKGIEGCVGCKVKKRERERREGGGEKEEERERERIYNLE